MLRHAEPLTSVVYTACLSFRCQDRIGVLQTNIGQRNLFKATLDSEAYKKDAAYTIGTCSEGALLPEEHPS